MLLVIKAAPVLWTLLGQVPLALKYCLRVFCFIFFLKSGTHMGIFSFSLSGYISYPIPASRIMSLFLLLNISAIVNDLYIRSMSIS
jgi:hypothetical protein